MSGPRRFSGAPKGRGRTRSEGERRGRIRALTSFSSRCLLRTRSFRHGFDQPEKLALLFTRRTSEQAYFDDPKQKLELRQRTAKAPKLSCHGREGAVFQGQMSGCVLSEKPRAAADAVPFC